jgi:hypothetical protein
MAAGGRIFFTTEFTEGTEVFSVRKAKVVIRPLSLVICYGSGIAKFKMKNAK